VTTRRAARPLAFALALVTLVGCFAALEVWRDRVFGEPAPGDTVLYVRSPDGVRRMSLGFTPLVADVYWVRAVQYYGGTKLSSSPTKRYDLLYPLLDITTSLDPRFNIAYRFGSIFLAESYPGGAGRPDLAVKLLEKGFRANPTRWQYLQDTGFVYYWWVGDYDEAAKWFDKAAAVPGAPWWLKSLAAVTMVQGGDRRGSRLLWQSLRETADNEWLRNNAAFRLEQLDALDAIDRLTAIVAAFKARTGEFPASWDALVRARMLRGLPIDPSGAPFRLNPTTGAVSLAPDSRLNPLPTGAPAGRPAFQPAR
jgi:tetratricopeptide (TPR) repeat protein